MSEDMLETKRPKVTFVWIQFGPYLMDRCESAAAALPDSDIVGVEIASQSAGHLYSWEPQGNGQGFTKTTLFPGDSYEQAGWFGRIRGLVRGVVGIGARHNFLCHYNMPSIFVLAVVLRLMGRKVFIMNDSKFDDRSRSLWQEIPKWLFLLPYNGALVGGRRHRDYLSFLGLHGRPMAEGFDTVSMARLRTLAGAATGRSYLERDFVVIARLIAKKNLPLVIAAYQLYREMAGSNARGLKVLSSGELSSALQAEVKSRNLSGVTFTGYVDDAEMARHLAGGLALILPSIEEQWGVTVNEAMFLGVPVLCSDNVGARDGLVRNGINGYVFAPDDAESLAAMMARMGEDEGHWNALVKGALDRAPLGDVHRFGEGVRTLVEAPR
jgi:glycosyltransferase involved in cell wall biosynthesis